VMKDLQASYNNPFDQVIRQHVSAIIETQLQEIYKEQIQAQIKDALAKAVTDDFVQKLVQVAIDRVGRY
jgi:FKBP-type peptidyl-prolyl cis-trans isomerase (trigger factor)